eukprot:360622-Chlamydomonas_euryale.AAC.1
MPRRPCGHALRAGRPGRRVVEGPAGLPPVGRALPARRGHRGAVGRRRAVRCAVGRLRGRPRRGRVVSVHWVGRPRPLGQQAHQQGAELRPGVHQHEPGAQGATVLPYTAVTCERSRSVRGGEAVLVCRPVKCCLAGVCTSGHVEVGRGSYLGFLASALTVLGQL